MKNKTIFIMLATCLFGLASIGIFFNKVESAEPPQKIIIPELEASSFYYGFDIRTFKDRLYMFYSNTTNKVAQVFECSTQDNLGEIAFKKPVLIVAAGTDHVRQTFDDGDKFFLVTDSNGPSGKIIVTEDMLNFTTVYTHTVGLRSIGKYKGVYIAGGVNTTNELLTSRDGITWSVTKTPVVLTQVNIILSFKGKLFIFANNGVFSGNDVASLSLAFPNPRAQIYAATVAHGSIYMAAGFPDTSTSPIYETADGVTWTLLATTTNAITPMIYTIIPIFDTNDNLTQILFGGYVSQGLWTVDFPSLKFTKIFSEPHRSVYASEMWQGNLYFSEYPADGVIVIPEFQSIIE